jgi:hypothetical protein
MKAKLEEYIYHAQEAKECYPDEPMEVSWLDAVPFDKDGNPTGEVNEWVVHRGEYVIADGFDTELEAEQLLDILYGELNEDSEI